jgi:hypothetical protein
MNLPRSLWTWKRLSCPWSRLSRGRRSSHLVPYWTQRVWTSTTGLQRSKRCSTRSQNFRLDPNSPIKCMRWTIWQLYVCTPWRRQLNGSVTEMKIHEIKSPLKGPNKSSGSITARVLKVNAVICTKEDESTKSSNDERSFQAPGIWNLWMPVFAFSLHVSKFVYFAACF